MPSLDGVEAAKQIKGFLPQAHIILFSGQASAAALVEKAAAEGHEFNVLAKPIKPEILLALISQFLGPSVSTSASKIG